MKLRSMTMSLLEARPMLMNENWFAPGRFSPRQRRAERPSLPQPTQNCQHHHLAIFLLCASTSSFVLLLNLHPGTAGWHFGGDVRPIVTGIDGCTRRPQTGLCRPDAPAPHHQKRSANSPAAIPRPVQRRSKHSTTDGSSAPDGDKPSSPAVFNPLQHIADIGQPLAAVTSRFTGEVPGWRVQHHHHGGRGRSRSMTPVPRRFPACFRNRYAGWGFVMLPGQTG